MIRGLYSAASGVSAQAARTDIYAANLANSSTNGYLRNRVSQMSFPHDLVASSAFMDATGTLGGGVTISGAGIDFTPGAIQQTTNSLDLAIDGKGFFCVSTPAGEGYTRNGAFQLSRDGTVVTRDGYALLGRGGPIRVGSADITIDEQGRVWEDGRAVDTLRISEIPNDGRTAKMDATVLMSTEANAARGFKVVQGAIEGSNVNTMRELQMMMSSQRQYEASIRAIQAQDDSLQVLLRDVVG